MSNISAESGDAGAGSAYGSDLLSSLITPLTGRTRPAMPWRAAPSGCLGSAGAYVRSKTVVCALAQLVVRRRRLRCLDQDGFAERHTVLRFRWEQAPASPF